MRARNVKQEPLQRRLAIGTVGAEIGEIPPLRQIERAIERRIDRAIERRAAGEP
jgi:hypothetical protein